jgi:hypothetical protein
VGDPDPILGVRSVHVGVLDQPGGLDRIYRGPALSHGGSGLTVDALEYITFSSHVAAPEPSTWWGQGCCWPRVVTRGCGESRPGPTHNSFSTRLKIATWVLRLHTVVRGTLILGYRQNTKAYRVFNKSSGLVEVSSDIVFDETNGSPREQVDLDDIDEDEVLTATMRTMAIGDVRPQELQEQDQPSSSTLVHPPTEDDG